MINTSHGKSVGKYHMVIRVEGWNQPNHQPVLKFPHFFPASLQAKTEGISKLVDDEAGSIL